jgi:hypothetical protein
MPGIRKSDEHPVDLAVIIGHEAMFRFNSPKSLKICLRIDNGPFFMKGRIGKNLRKELGTG